MATVIPFGSEWGKVGGLTTETFVTKPLFTGEAPENFTEESVPANTAIAAYSVVGRVTATKKVVLCNPGASDGSEKPIGIAAYACESNAAGNVIGVWRDGTFNPDALVWHSGFTTDEQKRLAFDASPAVTIIMRKPLFQES